MGASEIRRHVSEGFPRAVSDLKDLVAIPSVSRALVPVPAVSDSAEAVAGLLRNAGMPEVRILSVSAGAPAVVAKLPAPQGAPTILLYAHHDVQPAGDVSAWRTPPFEATEVDGRLHGRGAADDKAGVIAHVAAIRALREACGGDLSRAGVGIVVFVEGEEEVGSPTFAEFLQTFREDLAADVVVIADSTNRAVDVPAFTTTLRGLAEAVVEVRTLAAEQHSGVYGGAYPDALTVLCRLLATLHTEDGDVALDLHRAETPDLELDSAETRHEAGVLDGVQEIGTGSLAERIWAKPAVSVLALDAPRVADAANVLLPVARAKVSLRLAPGQDPEVAARVLRDHLLTHTPWGAHVEVIPGPGGDPVSLVVAGPYFDLAHSAFREAWDGTEPVRMGIGGSIPFIAEIAATYPTATILVVGPGDPASCWHGPNESVDLGVLQRLVLAEALMLARLGGIAG
jgi:cysteinylglycine-S-conjugate dipeptidase